MMIVMPTGSGNSLYFQLPTLLKSGLIEILLTTIERDSQELGDDFVRWTAQRLAIYLEKSTKRKLSGGKVRRKLKKKKYVYLWAKSNLDSKRNPEKRTAFKIKIA
ncbi:winged helix-turn-helix domain-containing protein [Microcoleus sp. Pol10D4]|uniref:winged helix-turn-helix domain-containing protein n=1 Tax=Microcoleus sp. Pol10D4 TaxID=3055387 RepID=UPI002FD230FE